MKIIKRSGAEAGFDIEKIIEASKTMDLWEVQSVGPWVEPRVWLKKGELEKVDLKGKEGKNIIIGKMVN